MKHATLLALGKRKLWTTVCVGVARDTCCTGQKNTQKNVGGDFPLLYGQGVFRSPDLWVMRPTRFLCATSPVGRSTRGPFELELEPRRDCLWFAVHTSVSANSRVNILNFFRRPNSPKLLPHFTQPRQQAKGQKMLERRERGEQ